MNEGRVFTPCLSCPPQLMKIAILASSILILLGSFDEVLEMDNQTTSSRDP